MHLGVDKYEDDHSHFEKSKMIGRCMFLVSLLSAVLPSPSHLCHVKLINTTFLVDTCQFAAYMQQSEHTYKQCGEQWSIVIDFFAVFVKKPCVFLQNYL